MWDSIVDSFSVRSVGSVAAVLVGVAALVVVLVSWIGWEDVLPSQPEESIPGTGSGNRENGLQSTDLERRASPPLVFIPGIKGSTLVGPDGDRVWLTWWQAFGLGSPDLRLPMRWERDEQQHDGLVAESPLHSVARQDIHASFLDWAETSVRAFHPFGYDWRRDNLETVDTFVTFLNRVSQQHGGAQVQVVAYSMGGLIAFVALNRRPDLFQSALFVGVPFGHGIGFLEDMHAGTATGLNKRILSPQVLFTFASPYSLFPGNESESGLMEQNGEGLPHDWYSPDDWERHKLGIFASLEPAQVTDEERAHLRSSLSRAREFRSLLVSRKERSFQYPPIAVLASDTHPTLSMVVRDGPRAVRGWDFQTAPQEAGDGRVLFSNAMPPEGVPYTVHRTLREHGALLKDIFLVSEVLADLCECCHK